MNQHPVGRQLFFLRSVLDPLLIGTQRSKFEEQFVYKKSSPLRNWEAVYVVNFNDVFIMWLLSQSNAEELCEVKDLCGNSFAFYGEEDGRNDLILAAKNQMTKQDSFLALCEEGMTLKSN